MQVCADVHDIAPAITIGYENRRVSSEALDETVLHTHGGAFQTSLLILHGEIKREVLDEEQVIVPQCHFEEGVQDSVPNAIGSCGAPVRPSAVRVTAVAAVAAAVVGADAVAFRGKCSTMCRVFSQHSLVWFSLSSFPHFSPFASCSVSRAS